MSALRIGTRVRLARCEAWSNHPPIGAEGVITGTGFNCFKPSAWTVHFHAYPCAEGEWLFESGELEPILEDGDFSSFMESVLRPTTLDAPPAKNTPKEFVIVR